MSEKKDLRKLSNSFLYSPGAKLIVIFILLIVMFIPVAMISSLVDERAARKDAAINEISSKWSNAQTITGPILTVPFNKKVIDEKGKTATYVEYAHFLPEKLDVKGKILPETRYRGIYETVVYNSELELSGQFKALDFAKLGINVKDIRFSEAELTVGISDLRGINGNIDGAAGNKKLALSSGLSPGAADVVPFGITANSDVRDASGFNFRYSMNLKGSKSLYFAPVGGDTTIDLSSSWASPSFDGAFLPTERKVTPEGFTAKWSLLQFNRSYKQSWIGNASLSDSFTLGVNLYTPVDVYKKTERVTKYAMLLIALTFAAIFIIEILFTKKSSIHVHPIQYLLVGLAITIFYTLLLSLSEQISFGWAYIASTIAIVTLIAAYSKYALDSIKLAAVIGALLASLYAYFYIILHSEDYALIMGSALIFATLATIMFLTRKVNWFAIGFGGFQTTPPTIEPPEVEPIDTEVKQ